MKKLNHLCTRNTNVIGLSGVSTPFHPPSFHFSFIPGARECWGSSQLWIIRACGPQWPSAVHADEARPAVRGAELSEGPWAPPLQWQLAFSSSSPQNPGISLSTSEIIRLAPHNLANPPTCPSRLTDPLPKARAERTFLKSYALGLAGSQFALTLGDGSRRGTGRKRGCSSHKIAAGLRVWVRMPLLHSTKTPRVPQNCPTQETVLRPRHKRNV